MERSVQGIAKAGVVNDSSLACCEYTPQKVDMNIWGDTCSQAIEARMADATKIPRRLA